MGCSAFSTEEPTIRVIPLQFQIINSYVDQYPRIMIQKLKQKFNHHANQKKNLTFEDFSLFYSPSIFKSDLPDDIESQHYKFLYRLFLFFTDLQQRNLTFKQFIIKYALINKCDNETLSQIIFFLYGSSHKLDDDMKKQSYEVFIEQGKEYFGMRPSSLETLTVGKVQFFQGLKKAGFLWDTYQKRFSLIEKEDVPFQNIGKLISDTEITDYMIGQEYYVISSAWFERWAYYYQGKDHTLDQEELKSTKVLKKKRSVYIPSSDHLKKMKRSSGHKVHTQEEDNTWLIEQPTAIQFDDIEGEFEGELKANLRVYQECRFISPSVWEMLKKLHPTKSSYKRYANSSTTLELYPKTIYYLKTNEKGKIEDKSLEIFQMPIKTRLQKLSQLKNEESYIFIKDFGQRQWVEEGKSRMLVQCSVNPRFFVVETKNKEGFEKHNKREEITLQNISYGDSVYSYFPFVKKVMEAYILGFPSEKTVKIHYRTFNFRYEIEVQNSNLSIKEQNYLNESIKLTLSSQQHLFKGLNNIGNTCFINTIIQCLIATPIMEKYFIDSQFHQKSQPLLTAIGKVSQKLLNHQKVSPSDLKKKIDVHLQMFSGYDQHDAQQFLNLLLDKMNEQIKSKPSIVDQLFGGQIQSKLRCCSCNNQREIEEKISILSLPIPEPEFNTFVIFVFPIYEKRVRKVIMRMHRFATLRQYLSTFQERMKKHVSEYIFCEMMGGSIKKVRSDFHIEAEKDKIIMDKGIPTNVEMHAYEKLRKSYYIDVENENKKNHQNSLFVDYYDKTQKNWCFGKLTKKGTFIQKYQDNGFSVSKIEQNQTQNIKPLGLMIRQVLFKKFFFRKYNSALRRMEFFGYEFMFGLPKYVSYSQIQSAIQIYIENYLDYDYALRGEQKQKPYYIRLVDSTKFKCLFCGMGDIRIDSVEELEPCCKVVEKDIPLIWVAKQKSYTIYVEWLDIKKYNTQILSVIDIDTQSLIADKQRSNDKIFVDQCFELLQKPEKVQMECVSCLHPEHFRTQIIKSVPNILVLHMKEFRITAEKVLIKLDVNLRWIEYLDISSYSVSQKGTIYELYAYVCHTGSNQSGHYTCVTKRKHPFENKRVWVNFDDDRAQILNKEQKNIDSAYLLFFKKVDMPISAEVNFTEMNGTVV